VLNALHEGLYRVRLNGVHTRILARKALAVAAIGVGLTAKHSGLVQLGLFALGVRAGDLVNPHDVAEAVMTAVEVDLEDGG
jgi:hypothetical protein